MDILKISYNNLNAVSKISEVLRDIINEDTLIVCIGSDRVLADSLAPMIGSILERSTIKNQIFGVLGDTIHALNLEQKIQAIKNNYPNSNIIAIDACISKVSDKGTIVVRNEPVKPGLGVHKNLQCIGDYSIVGVIGRNGYDIYDTSDPEFIFDLADVISESLISMLLEKEERMII
ncbi:TPA: spore protease YyaC [Clostridioides difficile]|uniref:spore protease YyaC n=1 Tax=Clostridioides difficile TaxID=1496 RepID=UPI00038C838E|nr:spore protease YyaC [Clostridioides difficile]OFU08676.1 spore protease YyaC [Clostridium sp. HMSC19D07]EGT5447375.1 spore protease YyaC [Clostridioides difficile]EII6832891.1 spore protease YyaC [Clostridioides difficile]EQJ88629.1 putative sporulation protein YyaC [Clostridioides difficile P50]MBF9984301.1 spore protease YyaC [Clostridioides difficile]